MQTMDEFVSEVEEWVAEKAWGLSLDISHHLGTFAYEMSNDRRVDLLKLIMMSIKTWDDGREAARQAEWDGE